MLHCNCACLKGEIKLEVIMAQNEQLYLIKSHTLHKNYNSDERRCLTIKITALEKIAIVYKPTVSLKGNSTFKT